MSFLEAIFILSVFYISFCVVFGATYAIDRWVIAPIIGRTLIPWEFWR